MYYRLAEVIQRRPVSAVAAAAATGFALGYLAKDLVTGYLEEKKREKLIEEALSRSNQLTLDFNEAKNDEPERGSGYVTNLPNNPKDIVVVPPEPIDPYSFTDDTPIVEPAVEDESGRTVVFSNDVVNIFHENQDGWNWDAETQRRATKEAKESGYTIHREEFFNEESGYGQTTLTYYQGDDILTDERDVPIYNYKATTGELEFGHGSGDPHIVYVRNDRLQGEYEILLEEGSYEIEVLGSQYDEPQASKGVRKFRDE